MWFGERFAAAGADYLSVSKGGRFEDARQPKVGEAVYPYTGRSGYECMPTVISDARGPFGRNVPLAAAIRAAVRAAGHATPVVTSGGIGTLRAGRGDPGRRGEADFVAAARQTLADPDWFRKIRLGHGHLVRRCEFTNYCEGLDQHHKQVTCKLWDRVRARRRRDPPGSRRQAAPRRAVLATSHRAGVGKTPGTAAPAASERSRKRRPASPAVGDLSAGAHALRPRRIRRARDRPARHGRRIAP